MIITSMAEGKNHHQLFKDSWCQDEDETISSTTSSSIGQESTVSNGSSITSADTADDASSSSASSSVNSGRALYDLSEIMTQLPIKRGLSNFYNGKSESFTAVSGVTSVEDLAKRATTTPCRGNMKSIATGLHSYRSYTHPKAIIAKKNNTKGSYFSSRRGGFMNSKPY